MKKIIDPEQIRWFHFFPVISILFLVWLFAAFLSQWALSDVRQWWLVAGSFGVQVIFCFVAGAVCRNWTGFAEAVSSFLYNVWSKDISLELENRNKDDSADAKSTRQLMLVDTLFCSLFVVFFLAGIVYLNRFNVILFGCAAEVAIASYMLAFFPGLVSAKIEDWPLREYALDESKMRLIVDELHPQSKPAHYDEKRVERKKDQLLKELGRTEKIVSIDLNLQVLRYPFRQFGVSRKDATVKSQPIRVDIREQTLQRLRDENRENPPHPRDLQKLVVNGRTSEIFVLCAELETIFQTHHLSKWDRIQSILGFCQEPNIAYEYDDSDRSVKTLDKKIQSDYWRYPLETLHDKMGDCDCHAILAASLFYTLGFDCCLIGIETTEGSHMALGVKPPSRDAMLPDKTSFTHSGDKYYYCETTGAWWVGEIPPGVKMDSLEVMWPIN